MKIVHVALYGPVTDGWNYQDNMIPKYQAKDGNKVVIIASKWVFNAQGKIEYLNKSDYYYDGVKIIRLDLKFGKNVHSKIKIYDGLYERLVNEKPDCIFVHNVALIDVKNIVKYAKKQSVKIYADNHNDFSNSARNWVSKNVLHKIIWKHYAQLLKPYVTKFYGVLPARVDFLENIYKLPKEKCELLVMGADDEMVEKSEEPRIERELRQKYGIEEDDFLILTGGKIDAFKTQTILLMEAVKNIQNEKVKLIVFGSVTSELKERVESLNDGCKVQYIGWIDSNESYSYFASADLVVFPGRHSVFWEQVAGQGKPMVCKYWEGTTHVNIGGNVRFLYCDDKVEIESVLNEIVMETGVYEAMCLAAIGKGREVFSYRSIACRAVGGY